jgi:hypothetical protein
MSSLTHASDLIKHRFEGRFSNVEILQPHALYNDVPRLNIIKIRQNKIAIGLLNIEKPATFKKFKPKIWP